MGKGVAVIVDINNLLQHAVLLLWTQGQLVSTALELDTAMWIALPNETDAEVAWSLSGHSI